MLVLSRKKGESIIIDGGIRISVLAVQGNKVRLGITAPKDVAVHRSEILPDADHRSDIPQQSGVAESQMVAST